MKIFTKKFFLLAIGMILSVGAYAQDEETPVVYHRFPEVHFTYTFTNSSGSTITRELTMPAWDAQFASRGQGYVRIQRINKTGNKKYTARIVTRQPLYNNEGSAEYQLTSKDAKIMYNGQEYALKDFTYDKIIPEGYESMAAYHAALGGSDNQCWGTTTDVSQFPVVHNTAIDDANYGTITGAYTIPTVLENTTLGHHDIIEIGPFAYRNPDWGSTTLAWFKPSSITIPKQIKKIYRDGLSVNLTGGSSASYAKKITFEAGSTITEIPVEAFMSCVDLQEINIPASVTSIGYGALGGCKNLKKIVFEGANPPSLGISDHGDSYFTYFDFVTSSGSTRNIGQTAAHVAADHAKCIMEVPMGSALSYTQKDDLYKKFPMMSKFTLNKDIVTYCSDLPFTFKQYNTSNKTWSDGSVKVYYVAPNGVDVEGRRIEFTEITDTKKIPTETENNETDYFGVLLKGTAGETYNIFYPNNVLTAVVSAENCLEGVITDTPIDINPMFLYYVLSNGSFLSVTQPGTLSANKAFIMYGPDVDMNVNNNARELALYFPGETTGISNYDVQSSQNDAFYTLQGIRVKNPEKGVFIKNGKKIIIK